MTAEAAEAQMEVHSAGKPLFFGFKFQIPKKLQPIEKASKKKIQISISLEKHPSIEHWFFERRMSRSMQTSNTWRRKGVTLNLKRMSN